MKVNKEEVKRIIEDLILNRDSEIREFNEKLYSNKDYTEILKRWHWFDGGVSEMYEYANWWKSYV